MATLWKIVLFIYYIVKEIGLQVLYKIVVSAWQQAFGSKLF